MPQTENEFKDALKIAETVVKWAESEISTSQVNEKDT
jgi:hypothetical protein